MSLITSFQPQRPVRSLRVNNDENVAPDGHLLRKTIHQRNKSSPALSMAHQLKAPKRSAFADVSNIISNSVIDASNPSKGNSQLPAKKLQDKKGTNTLRPPRRHYSVSNLKSILSNVSSDSVTKASSNEYTNNHFAIPKKSVVKRSTTIFKDISLEAVKEDASPQNLPDHVDTEQQQIPTLPPLPQLDVTSLDPSSTLPPPSISESADPVKSFETSEISLPGIDSVTIDEVAKSGQSEENDSIVPDEVVKQEPVSLSIPTKEEIVLEQADQSIPEAIVDIQPATGAVSVDEQSMSEIEVPSSLQYLYQPTPESEEHWEEEYDETYDGEGYVTARSFRSHGDDTTGGATTTLVPRFTQRVLNEIEAARQHVEATRTEEDIEDENFDTSMVAEYGEEIFGYMQEMEQRMLPRANYMDSQHEIQWSMRAVLMDWLVQVHHRFNLLPETLFLCVNYIDRFLSVKVVSLGKLQLVGATAIFIAAKYEEINCPSVQEIVYMVDGGYSVDEILKAERFMLTMLQFELGFPGPMSFLRRISKADDYDLETRTLAKYFLEVTLMDERFIGSVPSFLAAASHCLAREMLRKGSWSRHHVHYSGYTWSQLKPAVQLLLDCCEDPRKHHNAVFNKYCDKRYKRAAAFVETEVTRGFSINDSYTSKVFTQDFHHTYQYSVDASYA